MEATVMPATAPVQKQQGLNQVVINKVRNAPLSLSKRKEGYRWQCPKGTSTCTATP